MSELTIDQSTLSSDCVKNLQRYLNTEQIVTQQVDNTSQGQVLGVLCKINSIGVNPDSSLVIIAAQPLENTSWNFGTCFPSLPGAEEESSLQRLLRMRFLTLQKALWLFIWGQDIQTGVVKEQIATTDWFQAWAKEQGITDTSPENLRTFFDSLNFTENELQSEPKASWRRLAGINQNTETGEDPNNPVSGLFFWGDVWQTSATEPTGQPPVRVIEEMPWLGDIENFLGGNGLRFAKAKLEPEGGFPHLLLQLPPRGRNFGDGDFSFQNAAVTLLSVPYFTPQDTSVGVQGDFIYPGNKRISINLAYPIVGDLIWAKGTYQDQPEHLLGDSASFGLPEPPSFPVGNEISLELEFSKSLKTLLKLEFSVEINQTWQLLSNPIPLAIEGVSFYVTIFDPFNNASRSVFASLTAEATFGDPGDGQFRLRCGGTYPDGQLFLQLRESLPIGTLMEKLVGPSEGLQSLNFDALQIDYNYKTKIVGAKVFGLFLDVSSQWEIITGFNILNTRFRVEGIYGESGNSYQGSFNATLTISDVNLYLSANYHNGWEVEGIAENLPIGQLIDWLTQQVDSGVTLPESIKEFYIETLTLKLNSNTKYFAFICEGNLSIDNQQLKTIITIQKESSTIDFSGYITINNLQFNLIFSKDNKAKTFIAAYNNPNGDSLIIKNLVADVSNNIATYIPESLQITLQDALFAYSKNQEKTSFLFGLNLGSQLNLSNLPLVGKQFPPEQTIKVDDLQFIIASQNLNLEEAETFNNLIPETISKLPLPTSENQTETTPAIKKGFNLSANLQFGETTEILALPISSETEPDPTPETSPNPISDNSNITTTTSEDATWFSLQKTFGPVYFERIGIQYQDSAIWFLLDADLSFSGLTLSLDGLAVGSALQPFSPQFRLQGLGIDYQSGSNLTIAGAFLKLGNEYAGSVVISTSELTLSAIGSYSETSEGHPSLFIYGILDYPLGGPSFFFVTGLALGFAYNRSVILPTLDQVPQYPLVQAALSGATKGTTGLIEMQRNLLPYIPPQVGQIAFAVGIKFTSFKLIESFALLVVALGDRLEINLIGLSTIIAPSAEINPGVPPLAEVRIALLARFIPSEGILQVEGKVMPDSYVFARDCQLSGGFAFYCWFAGDYEGDFVLTVGGYHPDYRVPAHYPKVDRLGLNWRISDKLSIKGGIYFAITASAFMAGGRLEAVWQSGRLKAWYITEAHFLISWQPYFYDIRLSVKIGVAYTFKIFGFRKRISVDVSASLHIWGPEFSGTAKIDISVISFTVRFGNRMSRVLPSISWSEFKTSFLPASEEICTIRVKQGLLKTIEQSRSELWIMNPKDFTLIVGSVIPIKKAEGFDFIDDTTRQEPVGIAPMAANENQFSQSDYTITIKSQTNEEAEFSYEPVRKNVPIALWGEKQQTDLNAEKFVNVISGFEVKPKNPPKPGKTQAIPKGNLSYDTENLTNFYEWQSFSEFSLNSETDEDQRSQAIAQNIITQDSTRRQLLSELGFREEEINTIDLQALNNDVEQAFVIAPQLLEV